MIAAAELIVAISSQQSAVSSQQSANLSATFWAIKSHSKMHKGGSSTQPHWTL
jgi:hypothetical protein